jgi:hypothetical protein
METSAHLMAKRPSAITLTLAGDGRGCRAAAAAAAAAAEEEEPTVAEGMAVVAVVAVKRLTKLRWGATPTSHC